MGLFGPPDVGKLERKGDIDGLIKALRHKDESTRQQAAQVLQSLYTSGELAGRIDRSSVPTLTAALRDPSWDVRLAATYALLALDPTLDVLGSGLQRALDEGAVNATLEKLAENAREQRRLEAQETLSKLNSQDVDVRRAATRAISEFSPSLLAQAVDPLILALEDEDEEVRAGAAEALGDTQDVRAVAALGTLLEDPDSRVRDAVVRALARLHDQLGDAQAVEPPTVILRDEDLAAREAAGQGLEMLGAELPHRSLDEVAQEIVELEAQTPGPADLRLREIGEELYAEGGEPRMRAALEHAYGLGMTGRYVERHWTGIGSWMG